MAPGPKVVAVVVFAPIDDPDTTGRKQGNPGREARGESRKLFAEGGHEEGEEMRDQPDLREQPDRHATGQGDEPPIAPQQGARQRRRVRCCYAGARGTGVVAVYPCWSSA